MRRPHCKVGAGLETRRQTGQRISQDAVLEDGHTNLKLGCCCIQRVVILVEARRTVVTHVVGITAGSLARLVEKLAKSHLRWGTHTAVCTWRVVDKHPVWAVVCHKVLAPVLVESAAATHDGGCEVWCEEGVEDMEDAVVGERCPDGSRNVVDFQVERGSGDRRINRETRVRRCDHGKLRSTRKEQLTATAKCETRLVQRPCKEGKNKRPTWPACKQTETVTKKNKTMPKYLMFGICYFLSSGEANKRHLQRRRQYRFAVWAPLVPAARSVALYTETRRDSQRKER